MSTSRSPMPCVTRANPVCAAASPSQRTFTKPPGPLLVAAHHQLSEAADAQPFSDGFTVVWDCVEMTLALTFRASVGNAWIYRRRIVISFSVAVVCTLPLG